MGDAFLVPALTPHGHLTLTEDRDAPALGPELAQRLRDALDSIQLGAVDENSESLMEPP
jgi:hypothetical protein